MCLNYFVFNVRRTDVTFIFGAYLCHFNYDGVLIITEEYSSVELVFIVV